jgi:hypothetical protein
MQYVVLSDCGAFVFTISLMLAMLLLSLLLLWVQ